MRRVRWYVWERDFARKLLVSIDARRWCVGVSVSDNFLTIYLGPLFLAVWLR